MAVIRTFTEQAIGHGAAEVPGSSASDQSC
jgi:hypothetical protein